MSNFRFGIIGAAKIANKFCEAVALLDNCEVCAISSKSYDMAKDFATKRGMRCINSGEIESPVVPWKVTIACSELFDKIAETKKQ